MRVFMSFLAAVSAVSVMYAEEKKDDYAGTFSLEAHVYGTSYRSVESGVEGAYSALRVSPEFSVQKGGITGIFGLEYNSLFGASLSSEPNNENTGLGTGEKGIEVAQAYFHSKSNVLPSFSVAAGLSPYAFPLVWDDNAPLVSVSFEKEKYGIKVYRITSFEGSRESSSDDSEIYIAEAFVSFGGSKIRPAVFFFNSKIHADISAFVPGVKYRGKKGVIGGLSSELNFGFVEIAASAAIARGKGKDAYSSALNSDGVEERSLTGESVTYKSYALDVAASCNVGTFFKVTPFVTVVSGDANGSADGENNSFLNATIDGEESGVNNFRLFIVEDGGSFTTNSDVAHAGKNSNTFGYHAYGLSLESKLGELSVMLQGAYVRSAKSGPRKSKAMGLEGDARISYPFSGGADMYIEGAYLKTGSFYADHGFVSAKQNASYVNMGIKYSL